MPSTDKYSLSWTWDLTGNQERQLELTSIVQGLPLSRVFQAFLDLIMKMRMTLKVLLLQFPPLETRITSMHSHPSIWVDYQYALPSQFMGGLPVCTTIPVYEWIISLNYHPSSWMLGIELRAPCMLLK